MRLLLDACTFLWLATGSNRVSDTAHEAAADPGNEVFLSVVSTWEISIRYGLGDLSLQESPETFVPRMRNAMAIETFPLDEASTLHLVRLPSLHHDPFDRMLVAQALMHGLVILTPDELVRQYPARTLW